MWTPQGKTCQIGTMEPKLTEAIFVPILEETSVKKNEKEGKQNR